MKNQIKITEKLTKKIVSELIEKNDFLTIEVEGEWTLNKNAIVNDKIVVQNVWKASDIEFFEGVDSWNDAAKFIMSKYSYFKGRLTRFEEGQRLPSVDVTYASIEELIS
jgi:hypothetical protein